jgi:hypothetical protein
MAHHLWQDKATVQKFIAKTLAAISSAEVRNPKTGNIGMPTEWLMLVLGALMYDADKDKEKDENKKKKKQEENKKIIQRYCIRPFDEDEITGEIILPTEKQMWYLAELVRSTDTQSCYNTGGGLFPENGGFKDDSIPWKVKKFYRRFLEEFSKIVGISYETLHTYDLSMRVKRARFNDPTRSVTDSNGRSFVFLFFCKGTLYDDNGVGQFMEITRTLDALQSHGPDNVQYQGPKCEVCPIFQDVKFCSRCKKVRYCSAEHQKQDWDKHKLVCKKKI